MTAAPLGWLGIIKLGLVQAALGSIVVLTTSTMNRVMVVELALPAMLPGALVALHYALQVLRPRFGYGSDEGGRRTRWIVGGMVALALGGVGAALATAWMAVNAPAGIALAIGAFILIGLGVGAAGTSLLALMATRVAPDDRAAAAMTMWMMMIAGIIVTAIVAGHYLDPYSPLRLVVVTGCVAAVSVVVTILAVLRIEVYPTAAPSHSGMTHSAKPSFRQALGEVWSDPTARGFTLFVFMSMLAYSAQDLILEPFAGAVYGLTPGQSTKLAGIQHSGVFAGMLMAGILGSGRIGRPLGSLRGWTVGGCIASALALAALATGAFLGPVWPLRLSVFALGAANGVFAVAAIGSMMMLASDGQSSREGTRIGLWGAAQAIAFGLGGFLGTLGVDLARTLLASQAAYAVVFAAEGLLFLIAGVLAARLGRPHQGRIEAPILRARHVSAASVVRG